MANVNFPQHDGELFCHYFNRLEKYVLRSRYHYQEWELCEVVFNGLNVESLCHVSSLSNGRFYALSDEKKWELFQYLAHSTREWELGKTYSQPQYQHNETFHKQQDAPSTNIEEMLYTIAKTQQEMMKDTQEFRDMTMRKIQRDHTRMDVLETQLSHILSVLATRNANEEFVNVIHESQFEDDDFFDEEDDTCASEVSLVSPPLSHQANAVSLRNGRELEEAPKKPKKKKEVIEVEKVFEEEIEGSKKLDGSSTPFDFILEPLPEFKPQAPFPNAFKEEKCFDKKTSSIYECFRKCEVNIPLLDLLKSAPSHAKFLKELCTTKRANKAKSLKKKKPSEHVSALFQKGLPKKCGDPGMFTIPCKIGGLEGHRAMLDLGASINVLPHYLYDSSKFGPLKPTRVVISLADRSSIHPKGILEDVLVEVGDMVFPADFYVMEMERSEKGSTPILLGRPFMNTSKCKVDVYNGCLEMEFKGEVITYNVFEAMKHPNDSHSLCFLEIFQPIVQTMYDFFKEDPLDVALTNGMVGEDLGYVLSCDLEGTIQELEENPPMEELVSLASFSSNSLIEELPIEKLIPSTIEAPIVELKPLPNHLKYTFLGDKESYPTPCSSKLSRSGREQNVVLPYADLIFIKANPSFKEPYRDIGFVFGHESSMNHLSSAYAFIAHAWYFSTSHYCHFSCLWANVFDKLLRALSCSALDH